MPPTLPCPKCDAPKARRQGRSGDYRCLTCRHTFHRTIHQLYDVPSEPATSLPPVDWQREPEKAHTSESETGGPPPAGCEGILYMDGELNYTAIAVVPTFRGKDGERKRAGEEFIRQTCLAGDPSTGGHIAVVKCGGIVIGPDWAFRIGARSEEPNEDKTAPEPEWAITVVAAEVPA